MLVPSIDVFSELIPTAAGTDFNDVKTFVESAEQSLKRNLIGSTLYATIDGGQENEDNADLIRLCRLVVSLDAYYNAIPFLDIRQDGNSFAVVMSKNLAPASKDRVKKLRDATLFRRDTEIENLLNYLNETTAYHTAWKASDAYALAWELLIPSASMFSEFVSIEGRATFLKLRPSIMFAQNTIIAEIISGDFVSELVTQQKAGTLTAANLAIIEDLRGAIAHYAFSEGIETMAVMVDENGIGRTYQIGELSAANEAVLFNLKRNHKKAAERFMQNVKVYMDKNITDFTTYTESDEYTAITTPPFENTAESKAFVSPL